MPANVETMFYVREKPWHGLGTEVQDAPMSIDALILAGLDWEVVQKNVYTQDGSSGIKVAMTPIRVVCQNTLNLALNSAKRVWTTKHTENVMLRAHEAEETLRLAEKYMGELGRWIDALSRIKLTDKKVLEFMQEFFPVSFDLPDVQRKNNLRLLEEMK